MAFQASPVNIGDIFLGMVLYSLSLVVALIAIYRGAGPTVATGTVPAGVPMIHREGMP